MRSVAGEAVENQNAIYFHFFVKIVPFVR